MPGRFTVAARSKTQVSGCSPTYIVGSNPTGGHGCLSVVCVVCCQVEVSTTRWSRVQRSPTDCDASLCVIEKPQEWGVHGPRVGPQRHGEGGAVLYRSRTTEIRKSSIMLADLRCRLRRCSVFFVRVSRIACRFHCDVLLGAFAKVEKKATASFAMSVSPSVRPCETTRLPLDGFPLNLIFGDFFFWKSVRENSSFISLLEPELFF